MNLQEMTKEQLLALVGRLQADSQAKLTLKVTEKGAVGVYGLGRWPVTLYRSQWERLIPVIKAGTLDRFIEANADKLSVKGAAE